MSDEIKRVADWEPGTLDKTRKNIGNIDSEEAAIMAKKLGGEVLYEKSTSSYSNNSSSKNTGKIIPFCVNFKIEVLYMEYGNLFDGSLTFPAPLKYSLFSFELYDYSGAGLRFFPFSLSA